MKAFVVSLYFAVISLSGCAQKNNQSITISQTTDTMLNNNDSNRIEHTEEEWKNILTGEQYYVLREKGTERPFTGKFYLHKESGTYVCAGCGNDLFKSDMKFDSHCGWPSFDKEIAGGKIITQVDSSHGMIRTEIMCAKCGSHLGHLFDDGPTETGMRYCVNSISLDFKPNK